MHGLPCAAWLDQSQAAGAERSKSLPQMPCPGSTRLGRPDPHRELGPHDVPAPGHLLERGMPHRGARVECASENVLLSVMTRRQSQGCVVCVASSVLRVACCLAPFQLFGAELDVSKLPPPAQNPVAFERDVRPIFEQSCFRCHTGDRPKSHFTLDNREAALKGGENGIDII